MALFEGCKHEDIIELASGTGFYTRQIRERTTGKVYGIDISEDMVKVAQSIKCEGGEITYLQRDLAQPLSLGQKFDIVCAFYLFQYGETKEMLESFVQNIGGLLKEGGRLFIIHPHMSTLS
mmetsp:Transcript_25640/g.24944  ORF Transcript_25640/g.24944 Transcript_25640/m.24944 type:complete len:121 (-) Transcript_25640:339-701(-)